MDTLTYSEDVLRLNPDLEKLEAASKVTTPSKYHNARTESKGMTFASGHEAAGVGGLILAEEQRRIFALRLQVRFPLAGNSVYVADAVFLDEHLAPHVVDFKGLETPVFKLKAKLFRERYGQAIEEL